MGSGSVEVLVVVGISLEQMILYFLSRMRVGATGCKMVLKVTNQMNTDSIKIFHNAMYDMCWIDCKM